MAKPAKPAKPAYACPFVIAIDQREKLPFEFSEIRADVAQDRHRRFVAIETKRKHVVTGDYSIVGFENRIAIERKSLADAYATFSGGRKRFEKELARLQACDFGAVVVEADWEKVLQSPPSHTCTTPKTIYRSVIAWQMRFPRVQWWWCPGRPFAEKTTFRLLERFWKEHQRKIQEAARITTQNKVHFETRDWPIWCDWLKDRGFDDLAKEVAAAYVRLRDHSTTTLF